MKILKYIIVNGLLISMLCLWFIYDISGAKNVALFMIWSAVVTSFFICTETMVKYLKKQGYPYVPRWIDVPFDFTIVGLLLWHGFFVTATFFFIQVILQTTAIDKIKNYKSKESNERQT